MRLGIVALLFLSGTVHGSQPPAQGAKNSVPVKRETAPLPIATIISSRAFAVNGVPTPPAVTSADVASGDSIQVFYVPAIIKFADGRSATLAPGVTYYLPSAHDKPVARTTGGPGKFLPSDGLPPVSGRRP